MLDLFLHFDKHIDTFINKAFRMYGFVMRSSLFCPLQINKTNLAGSNHTMGDSIAVWSRLDTGRRSISHSITETFESAVAVVNFM